MTKDWQGLIKIIETEVASLKRLTPPTSLASLVRKGLGVKEAQVAVFKRAVTAVQAGMPPLQAGLTIVATAPDDSRIWAKVGVSVCQ